MLSGDLTGLRELIWGGVDLTARTNRGDTALHCAVIRGYTEVVRILVLTRRLDVNAQNNRGETAFYIACKLEHADIINLLKSSGCDLDIPDYIGTTPLLYAVYSKHVNIAKKLVAYGCDCNVPNRFGFDALTLVMSDLERLVGDAGDKGKIVRYADLALMLLGNNPSQITATLADMIIADVRQRVNARFQEPVNALYDI